MVLAQEPAREGVAGDEALLETPGRVRFWVAESAAVVVGLGLHHRLGSVVDLARCTAQGVEVLQRRAGGGALLLDAHVLCGAIALPTSAVSRDVTESYRWLGDHLVETLSRLGVPARCAEVAEARADLVELRASGSTLTDTCYGVLSPHEVVVDTQHGPAKLVGLAQVRRRDAALFQFGVLLRDQSALADFLCVKAEAERQALRAMLEQRTIGLESLTSRAKGQSASEVAVAIADAMPFAR